MDNGDEGDLLIDEGSRLSEASEEGPANCLRWIVNDDSVSPRADRGLYSSPNQCLVIDKSSYKAGAQGGSSEAHMPARWQGS